jgi:hypothetical protein
VVIVTWLVALGSREGVGVVAVLAAGLVAAVLASSALAAG